MAPTQCWRLPWDDWISLNGAKRCMGTAHVKKGLSDILNYIDEKEEDFEFNQDIDFNNDSEIRSPGWIRYQKKLK